MPFRAALRDALRRSERRLRRRLRTARRAGEEERAVALDGVRTAAEQLRAVAGTARGRLPRAGRLSRAAKGALVPLGEMQDTVVTREHCRRLGIVAGAAGENSFAYGRLHAFEQARAERAEAEFWARQPDLRRILR